MDTANGPELSHLERGGADAEAVGGLFQADAKLALQVLQPQPLPWLARVADALALPPRCASSTPKELGYETTGR